ncbi:hypothetical protein SMGD1_1566 [Sulfurimonas gotlandica GD1]|uniref:DUF3108 domain-containing protein n=2 Tax=Sulfurimonas TaxID=202746 RepID=H1FTX6_SULGG|nr:hypothetical protein SMGD1_1566 [Sulfurimonas gotlandica GD1]
MDYVGELSLFGKIADAEITYANNGQEYNITIIGTGSGIVGALTNHKKYVMQSIGQVKDGVLIPQKYINSEYAQDFKKIKTYTFDYAKNKTYVSEYKKERVETSTFNLIRVCYDTSYEDVETNKKEVLDTIFGDDMISMFFNKKNNLLSMKKNELKRMTALGSKDTQEGVIVKHIKHEEDKYIYTVSVEKDYLSGGSNDATFILDADNILQESRIDGILFFGNARVRRVK